MNDTITENAGNPWAVRTEQPISAIAFKLKPQNGGWSVQFQDKRGCWRDFHSPEHRARRQDVALVLICLVVGILVGLIMSAAWLDDTAIHGMPGDACVRAE